MLFLFFIKRFISSLDFPQDSLQAYFMPKTNLSTKLLSFKLWQNLLKENFSSFVIQQNSKMTFL